MQTASPHPAEQARRLAPFVLLSLVLHATLLFFIHPSTGNLPVIQPHPLEVYFSAPAVAEPVRIPVKTLTQKHVYPAKLMATAKTPEAPPAAQPEAPPTAATPRVFDSRQLMESAMNIVRDEARQTERQIAAQEKQKLSTSLGMLAQNLQQTRKETRLANGMLKIVTDAGTVCFQPVPNYARDTPGLYGIPTTCP